MLKENLVALRKKKHLTQEDIANLLKVKRQTYSAYERGISVPDAYALQKLASYFGVTVDYLLNNEDSSESIGTEPVFTMDMDSFEYALYEILRELDDDEKEELLHLAKLMRKKRIELQEKYGLISNNVR